MIFGSGTFSIRTSPALYITVARIIVVSQTYYHSDFSEAMSIEKQYFTFDFDIFYQQRFGLSLAHNAETVMAVT